MQKLFYLPEAHTDFLFAVLAEELGLVGVVLTLALFLGLVWRSFHIARLAAAAGLKFPAYLAAGFGLWIGIQAFINIGVNMGVLPTKGLTLPLMSYGRSSLIVALAWVGLLLARVSRGDAPAARLGDRAGRRMSRPILIMAGGTGGHVFPALALARLLREQSLEVIWLGTERGLESRVIPAEGIPIERLSIGGLRGKGALAWLAAPFRLTRRAPAGAVGDAAPPAERGRGARRFRDRPRRSRGVAHAPPARHPRAECRRRLHQPLPGASGAPGAGSLSRQLRARRARQASSATRCGATSARCRRPRRASPAAAARSASSSSAAARGRRA